MKLSPQPACYESGLLGQSKAPGLQGSWCWKGANATSPCGSTWVLDVCVLRAKWVGFHIKVSVKEVA